MSKTVDARITFSFSHGSEGRTVTIQIADDLSGRTIAVVEFPQALLGEVLSSLAQRPCKAEVWDCYETLGMRREHCYGRVQASEPPRWKSKEEVEAWQEAVSAACEEWRGDGWVPEIPSPAHLSQGQYDHQSKTIRVLFNRYVSALSSTPEGVQP